MEPEAVPQPASPKQTFKRKVGKPLRIGYCPGWHEEHAGMLAKYLFEDREYTFHRMDRNGLLNGKIPDVDVLICTGWNFAPELRELKQNAEKEEIPKNLHRTWKNEIWYAEKDVAIHEKGRPFLIGFNAEPWGRGKCGYDVIFDCKKEFSHTQCPTIYMPFATQSFGERGINIPQDLIQPYNFNAEDVVKQKREFAIFMVTQCLKSHHSLLALVRVVFYDMLNEYKKVTSYGGCRHNKEAPFFFKKKLLLNRKLTFYDESVFYYQPFKFVIAFENDIVEGYITEKLLNGIFSNSIPVYFGASDIKKYINPKRIVVCMNKERDAVRGLLGDKLVNRENHMRIDQRIKKFREILEPELTPCLQRIKELDSNREKFLEVLKEPFLPQNTLNNSVFDLRSAMKRVQDVMELKKSYLVSDPV